MKLLVSLVLLAVSISACCPSEQEIQATVQVSIAQTQAAVPTATKTATIPPTSTPSPTNTPEPTATFTPTPSWIVLTGTGDSVVDINKWEGAALLQIKYSGSRNFIVWSFDANGKRIDLLVNTTGPYEGTVPLDFRDGEATARLEIQSSGSWEFQILPLAQIRRITIPGTATGTGDDVILLEGTVRPDLLKIDASTASSNLIIFGYGNERGLLLSERAPYTGTIMIPNSLPTDSGSLILVIIAKDNWSIEVTAKN